jgi:hypothetical protein
MSTSQQNDIEGYVKLLSQLPPPKTAAQWDLEQNQMDCACGKKKIQLDEVRMFDTGYVKVCDNHCHDCLKDYKGLCPIVCIQCKKICAWLSPGQDKDGFKRVAGKAYHIDRCPECNPEHFKDRDQVTIIIEKQIYRQRKGL